MTRREVSDNVKVSDIVPVVKIETKMIDGRQRPRAGVIARILDKDGKLKEERRIAG
jgi:hypothetical protein